MAPIQERPHFPLRGREGHFRYHHYIFISVGDERVAVAGPGSKSDMRNKLPVKRRRYPDARIEFVDVGDGYWIRSNKRPDVPLEGRLHHHDSNGNAGW